MKKVIVMAIVMIMVLSISAQAFAYDYPYVSEEPPVALIKELLRVGFELSDDDDQWILDGKFVEEYVAYGLFDIYYNRGVIYGHNFIDNTDVVIEFHWDIDNEYFESDLEYEW
jgi:hypothetical protein